MHSVTAKSRSYTMTSLGDRVGRSDRENKSARTVYWARRARGREGEEGERALR